MKYLLSVTGFQYNPEYVCDYGNNVYVTTMGENAAMLFDSKIKAQVFASDFGIEEYTITESRR